MKAATFRGHTIKLGLCFSFAYFHSFRFSPTTGKQHQRHSCCCKLEDPRILGQCPNSWISPSATCGAGASGACGTSPCAKGEALRPSCPLPAAHAPCGRQQCPC